MNPMSRPEPRSGLLPPLLIAALASCTSSAPDAPDPSAAPAPRAVAGAALELLSSADEHPGKPLFEMAIPGSNGRSCATCHVLDEATTLLPGSVRARFEVNPGDPLFDALDADDPDADALTFEHLEKGLVRVLLPLPPNMDVIDLDGNVVTPPDRTIFVWRGVPTVANTALTGPYQLDGRVATLEQQAQAAIEAHSQGPKVKPEPLAKVADFQRSLFTSPRAWFVSELLKFGLPLHEIPIPEDFMPLSAPEKRGRDVYESACQPCHGSASTDRIVDREVHDLFFAELGPDGNVRFDVSDGQAPVAVPLARPDDEFLNVGFGLASYFGQVGLAPAFNADVDLPRYRFRFYTDATRSEAATDLPPVPVTQSGDPLDPRPALDERGAPIVGPNRAPQLFSTDPGRAAISGDPADFEAFDVPQLRGIAGTAPYYHDNSHETLMDVIDSYSRFVLAFIKPLALPSVHPPEAPGAPPESLSVQQKQDLLAFLRRL
jgi:cytochrome c peroxidase